jgi:hypothetical protein
MASAQSLQKKKIPWFLTRTGRGFSFFSAVAVGVGGSLMYFLPNAIFSQRFSKVYQMYKYVFAKEVHLKIITQFKKSKFQLIIFRGAVEVPVKPEIVALADDVMNKLGMHQNDKRLCTFFTAYGFDIMHVGSTYSKWGAKIGIPSNFYCKTKTDLDVPNIRVC